MDPSLEGEFGLSHEQMESLQYQLFSPVHSQWHLGVDSYVSYPGTGIIGTVHDRVNEHGTNEHDPDVVEFLESVLKENGSCSESDAEVVQPKVTELTRDPYCSLNGL